MNWNELRNYQLLERTLYCSGKQSSTTTGRINNTIHRDNVTQQETAKVTYTLSMVHCVRNHQCIHCHYGSYNDVIVLFDRRYPIINQYKNIRAKALGYTIKCS